MVQWHEMPFYQMDDGTDTERATFQCVLHANGTIGLNYLRAPPSPHRDYSSVSIGIEGPSGDHGPAKDADLTGPKGIALGDNEVFVVDTVRCLDLPLPRR